MIQRDVLLTSFNSLGVAAKAPWMATVNSEKAIVDVDMKKK